MNKLIETYFLKLMIRHKKKNTNEFRWIVDSKFRVAEMKTIG